MWVSYLVPGARAAVFKIRLRARKDLKNLLLFLAWGCGIPSSLFSWLTIQIQSLYRWNEEDRSTLFLLPFIMIRVILIMYLKCLSIEISRHLPEQEMLTVLKSKPTEEAWSASVHCSPAHHVWNQKNKTERDVWLHCFKGTTAPAARDLVDDVLGNSHFRNSDACFFRFPAEQL